MHIGLFGKDITTLTQLQKRLSDINTTIISNVDELAHHTFDLVLCDFDTVASEINTLFTTAHLPPRLVVLEKSPADATGKMLIKNGIMAYANTHMLRMHLNQLIEAVSHNKIWVYPELLKSIIHIITDQETFDSDLMQRLSPQEKEVVFLVTKGLNNKAIASKLSVTERTVKAHLSSIFAKLHVNDRLALVLLLKN